MVCGYTKGKKNVMGFLASQILESRWMNTNFLTALIISEHLTLVSRGSHQNCDI